jgi:ubiquinol-cytochrome c reductase cytochrome c1 subunit
MFRNFASAALLLRCIALCCLAFCGIAAAPAYAEETTELLHPGWSFQGPLGTFDRAALQRGFQVYNEVCSNCHALVHLRYGDLQGPDGLGYSEDEVKAIAAQKQVTDGPNDQGEMFKRPARPSDYFVRPFPNDQAARAANNGALPPDLSLITKSREGGADYVYSILNGYRDPPPDLKMADGMNYNVYFPGHQIAMPQPLTDGAVKYADGTKATVEQMSHDVVTFLSWTAEPSLETRHRMGVKVLLFLGVTTGVFYLVKRKVWSKLH